MTASIHRMKPARAKREVLKTERAILEIDRKVENELQKVRWEDELIATAPECEDAFKSVLVLSRTSRVHKIAWLNARRAYQQAVLAWWKAHVVEGRDAQSADRDV